MTEFSSLLNAISAQLNPTDFPRALSDEFGLSASSVERWIEGKTEPHPSLALHIVQSLLKTNPDLQQDPDIFKTTITWVCISNTIDTLAETFKTSKGTVERWISGTSTPASFVRPIIISEALSFIKT